MFQIINIVLYHEKFLPSPENILPTTSYIIGYIKKLYQITEFTYEVYNDKNINIDSLDYHIFLNLEQQINNV